MPVSERFGDWNYCNVQSAGGGCLIVKDKLYFYMSGRSGVAGDRASGVCGMGLATLRRDGFASLDASTNPGTLTTRPVRFTGKYLFVNAAARGGELRIEALDESGSPVEPFTLRNCSAIRTDKTLISVHWKGAHDLASLAGKPVRFRFHLRNGSLYAFWVSSDRSGASSGFVAAGGPKFRGTADVAMAK
jgi:hypothetical protein